MNTTINLLPISFRKRLLIRTRIRQWTVCLLGCLVVMSCVCLNKYSQMKSAKNELEQFKQKAEPVRKLDRMNFVLSNRSAQLSTKVDSVSQYRNSNLHLQVLGTISLCTRQMGNNIQIVQYRLEEDRRAITSQTKRPATTIAQSNQQTEDEQTTMKLDIQGVAVDDASIAAFIEALKMYDYLKDVKLNAVNPVTLSSKSMRTYQIECTF